MKKEIWKPIPGHIGYEASSLGRVRSLQRTIKKLNQCRIMKNYKYKGKIRSFHLDKSNGYLGQVLPPGKKMVRLHRAVWMAFNGEIKKGLQINHKNGIKTDNRIENLEVMTPKENTVHSMENGMFQRNHCKLLTKEDIIAIRFFGTVPTEKTRDGGDRKYFKRGSDHIKTLCKIFNRPNAVTIYDIINRKTYRHIP